VKRCVTKISMPTKLAIVLFAAVVPRCPHAGGGFDETCVVEKVVSSVMTGSLESFLSGLPWEAPLGKFRA